MTEIITYIIDIDAEEGQKDFTGYLEELMTWAQQNGHLLSDVSVDTVKASILFSCTEASFLAICTQRFNWNWAGFVCRRIDIEL